MAILMSVLLSSCGDSSVENSSIRVVIRYDQHRNQCFTASETTHPSEEKKSQEIVDKFLSYQQNSWNYPIVQWLKIQRKTPGTVSEPWSIESTPTSNQLFIVIRSTPPKNFTRIRREFFLVMLWTVRQTDRQTDRRKYVTSLPDVTNVWTLAIASDSFVILYMLYLYLVISYTW